VDAHQVPTDGAASTLKPPPIFLEGITTDTNGNLYVVDGRVLKLDLHGSGQFSVVAEWDGEPNGLALSDDGTLGVADYKQGVVSDSNRSRPQADTRD
jgi:sugar lactone lactonase YvrE